MTEVQQLEAENDQLRNALQLLAVACRTRLDCYQPKGDGSINGKAVINFVHDYCAAALECDGSYLEKLKEVM